MFKKTIIGLLTIVGLLGLCEAGFGLGLKPIQPNSPIKVISNKPEIASIVPHRVGVSLLSPVNRNALLQRAQQAGPYAELLRPGRALVSGGSIEKLGWENSLEAGASVNGTFIGRWGVPIIITVTVGVTIYLVFIARGR